MTSTIRIQAHQAKAGDVVTFNNSRIKRTVTSLYVADGSTVVTYSDGWVITHELGSVVTVELPETHPIAVLERQIARVEEQRRMNHQAYLETVRTGDEDAKHRRVADAELLRGKAWGLQYAVNELRAGVEFYPGKS